MPRNRKVSKPELVISSGQLSFTAEIERHRERAKVFLEILMKDQCRNVKYINTQVRFGDLNEEVRARTLNHIMRFQDWVSELLYNVNTKFYIYHHRNLEFFKDIHREKKDLYVSYPQDSDSLAEMLERAVARLSGFYAGYKDVTEPYFADYVKGSINQLKRAYLMIK